MQKFLVDECAGKKLCSQMALSGLDTIYVGDIMKGATDEEVIEYAEKEKRIIITNDSDFGKLVFRKKIKSWGIILLRLKRDIPSERIIYIGKIIKEFPDKLEGRFVVVSDDKIRIRKIIW